MNSNSTNLLIDEINRIIKQDIHALNLPEIVYLNELLEISKHKHQSFETYWIWEKNFY